jgi:ABC-2 type transport system permease protein
MTWVLVRKLLRDVCLAAVIVATLLFLFQVLWARITSRVTTQIITDLQRAGVTLEVLQNLLLGRNEIIGQLVQAIIGGEQVELDKSDNFMSIAYVHPLPLTILGIFAIGRAANAIAGEIDRGTMELLLAQPIRRTQLVLAHLVVDMIVIPALCLAMWVGTYCGTWWNGLQTSANALQRIDPLRFLPALLAVAGLVFAHSGVTMWISSMGRSRARVWGWAITLFLCMFLINVFGQILPEALEWLRPFTVHYHYQPQRMIFHEDWYASGSVWFHLGVLIGVGAAGYLLAWTTFCRRDLPAPL